MKRTVAFVGSMVCVVLLGLVALVHAGSNPDTPAPDDGGIVVKRVTETTGIRADISKYPVLEHGKSVEGRKLLMVLGGRVYVNMKLVFPSKKPKLLAGKWPMMPYYLHREQRLIYGHLVGDSGFSHTEALEKAAEFTRQVPGMTGARAAGSGLRTEYSFPEEHPAQVELQFDPKYADRYKSAVPEKDREKARSALHRIVKGVAAGKKLVIHEGEDFELIGK